MMKVRVGQWVFACRVEEPTYEIESVLEPFLVHGPANADFQLNCRVVDTKLSGPVSPERKTDEAKTYLRAETFEASWLTSAREIEVTLWSPPGTTLGFGLRNPLMNMLQIVATEVLRPRQGLFFHAASLQVAGGVSVLVPGIAGSGKTTFASGPWVETRFTDEHALLDLGKEEPVLWGVPFSGRQRLAPAPGAAPLDMILLIEKGEFGQAPALARVSQSKALQVLLRSLICFDPCAQTLSGNIDQLLGIVRHIPVYRLHYHPDNGDDAVELLRASLRAA